METKMKRRDCVELFSAISGLCRFSTQAGFYLGINLNAVEPFAKDHDKFIKTLQLNYADFTESTTEFEDEDNKRPKKIIVFEEDGRTPKITGLNLLKFDEDYEKYMDEEIEVKDLRPFSKQDLKVRITRPGVKSELVEADLPGEHLARLLRHGLINDFQ